MPSAPPPFTGLDFSFDPQLTDEHATCMVLSDEACVMLLDQPRLRDFTDLDGHTWEVMWMDTSALTQDAPA